MARFSSLALLCATTLRAVLSAPVAQHASGGQEHIVIIDKDHPTPPHVAEVLERLALSADHADVRHVYNNSAFHGFAASMQSHCLDLLANMTDISLVEQAVHISSAAPVLPRDTAASSAPAISTRANAPWGLQRISSASSMSGSTSALAYTYAFADPALGRGADIYVIDTGIYTANAVFGGRAQMVWSFDGSMADNDGHGTHVAGTAGGAVVGVASNANVLGLKALDADGSGWSSDIVAAIDFAIQTHELRAAAAGADFTGSVISMSLASSAPVAAINAALESAVGAGMHACVAAGNAGGDACASSPASAGGAQGPAITVGALDIAAQLASFSNTGACVDVYAPGVDVLSAWPGAPNMVNLLSGTSMATPHVTGLVAYAMAANATLARSPALMKAWVRAAALSLPGGELMANNGVRADTVDGLLGFDKADNAPVFAMAEPSGRGTSVTR